MFFEDDNFYDPEIEAERALQSQIEEAQMELAQKAQGIPVPWFTSNSDEDAKPSKASDTYALCDLAKLLDGPKTIDWLLDGIIPPKSAGLLAGDSGVGKTWITLDLALAVATGTDWLGQFPVKQGRVLIVDEENADILLRVRLDKLLNARGLNPANVPIRFLVGVGVNFAPVKDNKGRVITNAGYEKLLRTIKAYQPALVIFDSLTRCHTANENAAGEMAQVFANVKKLVNETNTSVLFTHHTRKGNGGDYGDRIRGSTDIRAFVDYTLFAESVSGSVLMTHDKSRWSTPVAPFTLSFDSTEDDFSLAYNGASSKVNLRDIWEWMQRELAEGQLSRAELLKRAEDANLCKQRAMDKTLSWRVEHGFLVKEQVGKAVFFSLPE